MRDNRVTVVINTLNRRDHLRRTLVALLQQTQSAFEVVVVNGPSTDGTAELLDQFALRVRQFTCDEANLGRSRNIGVRQAAGDLVAFIDDDAIPPPDWLELLVPCFDDEHVGAVGGPVFDVPLGRIDWNICTSTRLGAVNTNSPAPISMYTRAGSDPFPYLAGCNMAFRRSALQEVGGFNSMLSYGYDDVDVCCRINDAGHRIEYVEGAVVHHDRAASAIRDEQFVITDPYVLLRSRVVFAMQSASSTHSRTAIALCTRDWAREWGSYSFMHVESGNFSLAEHEWFVARAAAGVAEGIEWGREHRPFTFIGPPPVGEFRPYRDAMIAR
ncbi:MAG: glycosyltransferase family 2 protein [Actinobacteria bacterium]|nr:glycosyltransferase family 2 protein [Actinomycetota bacterium]